ncbi:Phosphate-selective porin O and P [Planctomycetales bacterium 10988]|nr:Phosphate-selective porin O and P [Planctomycetales bacterium 10988]
MKVNGFTTRMIPRLKWGIWGVVLLGATNLASAQHVESQYFPPAPPQPYQTSFAEAAAASTSEDDSLSKRVEELETAFKEAKEAKEEEKKKAAGKPTISFFGRIHLDVWGFPGDSPLVNQIERGSIDESPEDRVAFRRMRVGVKGDLPANMLYKFEMELAGGNDSQYRDCFFGWEELPVLQTVLIGNQKRTYGLDHLNSSRYNVFMERPYIIEAFNQDARRIGVCSYGVSDNQEFNWRYGAYMGEIAQSDAGPIGDPWQGEICGRFAHTIWYDECSDGRGYAHWAISGAFADPASMEGTGRTGTGQHESTAEFRTRPEARSNQRWLNTGVIDFAETYELMGLEAVVNVGALQIVGEYQNVWLQRSEGLDNINFHGGYVYVSYFLTGEHTPWDRESGTLGRVKPFENFFLVDRCCGGVGSGMGAWQVAARYSYADLSDGDINPILGGTGDSVTFGLNWWWTPYSRLQLNYIHGRIEESRFATAETGDSGEYDIVGARFMCDW